MNGFTSTDYPTAKPFVENTSEMATAHIKIIVASKGLFCIAGAKRTAFIVGSRVAPIKVTYSQNPSCTEVILPSWAGTAVLGVSGRDLSHTVTDVSDLQATPFLDALQQGHPDALEIGRQAYRKWSTGRPAADAHIARRVWSALKVDPARQLGDIAHSLGLSDRRIRAAVRQETGLAPSQWRKLIRLEKSKHMIADGSANLAAVALDAGYADQSHMNRDFIELAGVRPATLRRAVAAN